MHLFPIPTKLAKRRGGGCSYNPFPLFPFFSALPVILFSKLRISLIALHWHTQILAKDFQATHGTIFLGFSLLFDDWIIYISFALPKPHGHRNIALVSLASTTLKAWASKISTCSRLLAPRSISINFLSWITWAVSVISK